MSPILCPLNTLYKKNKAVSCVLRRQETAALVNCVFSLTFYPFFGRLSAPCPYRPTNRHIRENGCRPADGTAPVRRKTHRRILPALSLRRIPANRNMPTREMHRCRTAAPNADPPNNHPRRSRSQHSEARSEKAGNAGQTRAVPEHADICGILAEPLRVVFKKSLIVSAPSCLIRSYAAPEHPESFEMT